MNRTSKFLAILSFIIVFLGFGFLWFGLRPVTLENTSRPFPTPTAESIESTNSSEISGVEGQKVLVTKVIDGDTIEVEGGLIVRFIGIDTPETKDPRRPVGCFGKEASNETSKLLSGKKVLLEKDISETDKYKRLLRYIFLPLEDGNWLFVNDYLVREGFAKVLTYPPDVKYNEQLREAEREAKDNKRGLWGKC